MDKIRHLTHFIHFIHTAIGPGLFSFVVVKVNLKQFEAIAFKLWSMSYDILVCHVTTDGLSPGVSTVSSYSHCTPQAAYRTAPVWSVTKRKLAIDLRIKNKFLKLTSIQSYLVIDSRITTLKFLSVILRYFKCKKNHTNKN